LRLLSCRLWNHCWFRFDTWLRLWVELGLPFGDLLKAKISSGGAGTDELGFVCWEDYRCFGNIRFHIVFFNHLVVLGMS